MEVTINGLIKYGKKKYIEKILDGCFYCNTPEYFRKDNNNGRGDKFENTKRYQKKILITSEYPELKVNYKELTIHHEKDRYLHCWTMFQIPKDTEELEKFVFEHNKMIREFEADSFVFLPADKFIELEKKISTTIKHFGYAPIKYVDSSEKCNMFAKRKIYSYQNEFRFVFENCDYLDLEPKSYQFGNLEEFLMFNPQLLIVLSSDELPQNNVTLNYSSGLWEINGLY